MFQQFSVCRMCHFNSACLLHEDMTIWRVRTSAEPTRDLYTVWLYALGKSKDCFLSQKYNTLPPLRRRYPEILATLVIQCACAKMLDHWSQLYLPMNLSESCVGTASLLVPYSLNAFQRSHSLMMERLESHTSQLLDPEFNPVVETTEEWADCISNCCYCIFHLCVDHLGLVHAQTRLMKRMFCAASLQNYTLIETELFSTAHKNRLATVLPDNSNEPFLKKFKKTFKVDMAELQRCGDQLANSFARHNEEEKVFLKLAALRHVQARIGQVGFLKVVMLNLTQWITHGFFEDPTKAMEILKNVETALSGNTVLH